MKLALMLLLFLVGDFVFASSECEDHITSSVYESVSLGNDVEAYRKAQKALSECSSIETSADKIWKYVGYSLMCFILLILIVSFGSVVFGKPAELIRSENIVPTGAGSISSESVPDTNEAVVLSSREIVDKNFKDIEEIYIEVTNANIDVRRKIAGEIAEKYGVSTRAIIAKLRREGYWEPIE